MKKFVSMLLALAMCLALTVPAFAEEEETAAPEEGAAQKAICSHIDYKVEHGYEVDPDNYDRFNHALCYMEYKTCLACNERIGSEILRSERQSHWMYDTGHSGIVDIGGEYVTLPLYACRQCNYSRFGD